MSTWGFVKRRLIRLHPMVIFGSLFGAALFYFGDCSSFPLIGDTPWYKTALIMLWAFTMIPIPTSMDIRGWGETNPLNGPAWSLQWEYLANFLYAVLFRHFSRKALGACVVLFGIMTLVLCLNIDIFGFLAARSSASYTVIGGWCLSPDQLQIGLTRLLYPFFCGLLLSRVVLGNDCRITVHALDGIRSGRKRTLDKRALRSCLYPGFLSAYRIHRRRKQRKGKHLGKHQ